MNTLIMRIAPSDMDGVIESLKLIDPDLREVKREGNKLVVEMKISITRMFNLKDNRINSIVM